MIEQFNAQAVWHNKERYAELLAREQYVPIVIRAAKRQRHVREMLAALANVAQINRTVLVVSHDVLDPGMLAIVANVTFMTVKQIVNPHSANVWLDRFPGTDSALAMQAQDSFHHPRTSGVYPGMKNHFWWHLHELWDRQLPASVQYAALIEEDHLPTFDMYVAMRGALRALPRLCADCGGLVLGHHTNWRDPMRSSNGRVKPGQKPQSRSFRNVGSPFGVRHITRDVNLGLVLSRDTFKQMSAHAETFCHFDDYNWDLTLEHMRALKDVPPQLLVLHVRRLFILLRDKCS